MGGGDSHSEANALLMSAEMLRATGQDEAAQIAAEEALTICKQYELRGVEEMAQQILIDLQQKQQAASTWQAEVTQQKVVQGQPVGKGAGKGAGQGWGIQEIRLDKPW